MFNSFGVVAAYAVNASGKFKETAVGYPVMSF
jgi:hypothetical protein